MTESKGLVPPEGIHGVEDERCGAKTRSGGRCKKRPLIGGVRCRNHGGASPQALKKAERRLAMAEFRKTYGEPEGNEDPAEIILREIRWSSAHVLFLREKVQAESPEALVWNKTEEVEHQGGEWPGTDVKSAAAPSMWIKLYDAERDRLFSQLSLAAKIGLEERQIRIAERQAEMMFKALNAALDQLGLTDAQIARVPHIMPQIIRGMAVESGAS